MVLNNALGNWGVEIGTMRLIAPTTKAHQSIFINQFSFFPSTGACFAQALSPKRG
jgi:hypothetical protein